MLTELYCNHCKFFTEYFIRKEVGSMQVFPDLKLCPKCKMILFEVGKRSIKRLGISNIDRLYKGINKVRKFYLDLNCKRFGIKQNCECNYCIYKKEKLTKSLKQEDQYEKKIIQLRDDQLA